MTNVKPSELKMITLKVATLMKYLPENKVKELYGCAFEFTIKGDVITELEVWYNPRGEHNYSNKYRQSFPINNLPVSCILQ